MGNRDRNKIIEEFYEENYDTFIKKVKYRAGGEKGAEDVVQESFLRAIQYWDTLGDFGSIKPWFNRILFTTLCDYQKSERHSGASFSKDEDGGCNFFELGAVSGPGMDVKKYARGLIAKRKDSSKEVLELVVIKGYSYNDAHRITGASEGSIRTMVSRFYVLCYENLKLGEGHV